MDHPQNSSSHNEIERADSLKRSGSGIKRASKSSKIFPSGLSANQNLASLNAAEVSTVYGDVEEFEDASGHEELLCGYGWCTPKWLQWFHTPRWLLFFLGICAFVQSFVVNAIFPVGLSNLERQFNMNSTQTGIISSWYDLAVLLIVFIVCHYGNSGHKGRWIGLGAMVMGFGSFVCTLPHFLSPIYRVSDMQDNNNNESDVGQCSALRDPFGTSMAEKNCPSSSGPELNIYFLIFLVGQTLHGIGATPLFSIGTSYLDENVSQKASPVYLATHALTTTFGSIIGLFVGGMLLTIYVDFDRVNMSSVPMKSSKDPRWIGAWWLGFLGCGVVAVITSIPILGFARELPEARRHREKDINQVHTASNVNNQKNKSTTNCNNEALETKNIAQLPRAIWNILRNPTFVACVIVGVSEAIITNGFSSFMPKIMETILSTTPNIGSYLASLVIFAAATGVMVGGVVVRKLALQVPGMLKMMLVCHVIALVLISCLLVQCPGRDFVGITVDYEETSAKSELLSLHSDCNSECHCRMEWNPVCDQEANKIYYSACFAGCKRKLTFPDKKGLVKWTDCSCKRTTTSNRFPSNSTSTLASDGSEQMVQGFCNMRSCGTPMYVFLTLLFCSVVASFAAGIPSQQIMLRVIPFQQRTMGIGVNWTFLRLFGYIPGGVIFGMIIDTACLKWKESTCGKKQSCLVYDPHRLAWTIMALAIVCKLISILAAIIGYVSYEPNEMDSSKSIQTIDSKGPLSLTINDDRNRKTTAINKNQKCDESA